MSDLAFRTDSVWNGGHPSVIQEDVDALKATLDKIVASAQRFHAQRGSL